MIDGKSFIELGIMAAERFGATHRTKVTFVRCCKRVKEFAGHDEYYNPIHNYVEMEPHTMFGGWEIRIGYSQDTDAFFVGLPEGVER